ncbi:MAG: hypothetical protein ABJD11_06250, partial [Gemmatimonadota bacterium]
MVLTGGVVSVLFAIALGSPITARPLQSEDPGPNVRRLAAIAGLAAQEYRVGIKDGRITAPEEVQEAKLFLTEARRTAGLLPADAARATAADLDQLLALIEHVASPDSVDASVSRLSTSLASRLGVTLDEIPALTPSLARGAEIYQSTCASC